MPKNKISLRNTNVLACCALFVAVSIICGKYLMIPVGEILRFSLENLTIILAGIMFGPIIAALVALLADFLGCILVGFGINYIVMAGAVSIGIISGTVYKLSSKSKLPLSIRLALTVFSSHIIGSVLIKTIGLAKWYSLTYALSFEALLLWRLLNYIVVGTVEYIILFILLRRRSFNKQINSIIEK